MPVFHYRKSSYSNVEHECVEVATNIPTTVAIRDSKNPGGPHLRVRRAAWQTFQTSLTNDDLLQS